MSLEYNLQSKEVKNNLAETVLKDMYDLRNSFPKNADLQKKLHDDLQNLATHFLNKDYHSFDHGFNRIIVDYMIYNASLFVFKRKREEYLNMNMKQMLTSFMYIPQKVLRCRKIQWLPNPELFSQWRDILKKEIKNSEKNDNFLNSDFSNFLNWFLQTEVLDNSKALIENIYTDYFKNGNESDIATGDNFSLEDCKYSLANIITGNQNWSISEPNRYVKNISVVSKILESGVDLFNTRSYVQINPKEIFYFLEQLIKKDLEGMLQIKIFYSTNPSPASIVLY